MIMQYIHPQDRTVDDEAGEPRAWLLATTIGTFSDDDQYTMHRAFADLDRAKKWAEHEAEQMDQIVVEYYEHGDGSLTVVMDDAP